MVGPTPPQKLQIQPPPSSTPAAAASAEEEALKRNTDCVYFLASPLTCKKGIECEYRHSDAARLNPRDCWYWLNGSCLNPKCAFRHPPLDGLLGAQVTTPTGSSAPPVASVAPTPNVPYGSSKQGVPCIFFQQGFCLKGDRCPFFHAPLFVSNKAPPHPVSTASASTEKTKFKAFGGLEKCVQEKTFFQANIWKSGELSVQAQPVEKLKTPLPKNNAAFNENVLPPNPVIDVAHHRHKPKSVLPPNGNPVGRSNRVQQSARFDDHSSFQNKDDEISRDLSPGFDVLVDDELRGTDFYHGEGRYGRNEGRNEYDIGRSADFTSIADVDQDMYHDVYGHDSHDRLPGRSGRVQHRASSERVQGESAHLERRRYGRAHSPEEVREPDLRHRLSKHNRTNGLRSVISHDYASEKHVEDRGYQSSRRDRPYIPSHDSSLASRLRGRIKLPSRSPSPTNGTDMRLDRARDRGRLSSERPQLFSQQGRLRDRIKGRVQEDLNDTGRNNSGPRIRRDVSGNDSKFSGPRSLAELKGRKTAETTEQNIDEQQALGKRKFQKRDDYQQTGGGDNVSFDGPMPLQEILKRKRSSKTGMPSDKSEDYQHKRKDHSVPVVTSSISRNNTDFGQKEESDPPSGVSADHQSPAHHGANELEAEEGMIVEEADDQDPEAEGHDQRNGDYDYEQVDGEDYNLDEGENIDAGEEYLDDDDDDEDDFAKKMGVVFS
ncbi:hypothetical protein H5410_019850 [Solanum commersonii]|uniref:C3H1-type domain-containing protein n=1 Tax=Solanum commersonii TaxID=4109 RepID=A0A9J5Z6S3_SOLCO|nr:hypothetical protein H5410_019850 [Solanum commersonii]